MLHVVKGKQDMNKQIKNLILITVIFTIFGSPEIKAETSSIGYIGSSSTDSTSKDTSTSSSSMGYIGAQSTDSSKDIVPTASTSSEDTHSSGSKSSPIDSSPDSSTAGITQRSEE